MRPFFVSIIVAAALAAGSLTFCMKQRGAREEAQRELSARRDARARLDVQARQLQERLAAADAERSRLQSTIEAARQKNAAVSPPAPRRPDAPASEKVLRDALLNNPELQNLRLA